MTDSQSSRRQEAAFARYAEELLRDVADNLLKPRSTWPVEDLREKCVAALDNPVLIDRRLKELPAASLLVLKLAHVSGQPIWRLRHLLHLLAFFDQIDGTKPVVALLEHGLAFPEIAGNGTLRRFEEWLGQSDGMLEARVFIPSAVSKRAKDVELQLPEIPRSPGKAETGHALDGWDWPLRIAVAWQRLEGAPVKLTHGGALYKRELVKLQTDTAINAPAAVPLPDQGVLAFLWACRMGLFAAGKTEIEPGIFDDTWAGDLSDWIAVALVALFSVEDWNPADGYAPDTSRANLPSILLVTLLMLDGERWTDLAELPGVIARKHPDPPADASKFLDKLVEGVLLPLRIVEVAKKGDAIHARLADAGRWLLHDGPKPKLTPPHLQTLTVQPNGEIILFRQHLKPALVAELSRFALWKVVGPACTLEVQAERVYRGLEGGLSLAQVRKTLETHGMYAIPANVLDSLNRWARQRERVTVHPSATLLEFAKPEELEEAYRKGLIAQKLTDRIGLSESTEIDYKHYRLLGNRDYEAPPLACLEFHEDGLRFDVVTARADLLLEAELKQLADPVPIETPLDRRPYRLTLDRLRSIREHGWTEDSLDQWFLDRTGQGITPAAKMLLTPPAGLELKAVARHVVSLPDADLGDGLMQWEETAGLIEERLGPARIVVAAENLEAFRAALGRIGIQFTGTATS